VQSREILVFCHRILVLLNLYEKPKINIPVGEKKGELNLNRAIFWRWTALLGDEWQQRKQFL